MTAPAPYHVLVEPPARRALANSLPLDAAAAIGELLAGDLTDNPYRVGKRLRPPLEDTWSARRGEYRVLYRISDDPRTVRVVDVRHRRDAYRTR